MALYGARAPLFAPGSRPQYSNYGFILLGRIIEVVSGLSYDDYVQQHIFTPAHMTATGMQPETTILPDRAVGYMTVDGRLKSAADTQPLRGTSAGGGYSTVGDLKRFADALMSNQLLDAAHTQLLTDGRARSCQTEPAPITISAARPRRGGVSLGTTAARRG